MNENVSKAFVENRRKQEQAAIRAHLTQQDAKLTTLKKDMASLKEKTGELTKLKKELKKELPVLAAKIAQRLNRHKGPLGWI